MKTPHKYAELIKAWADGAEIEWRSTEHDKWKKAPNPEWFNCYEYRIKPEPKPDVVYYGVFDAIGSLVLTSCFTKINEDSDQIKIIFDGKTGKLKSAEVL